MQKLHNVDLENARVSADDCQTSPAGGGGYQVTQLENENSNFDIYHLFRRHWEENFTSLRNQSAVHDQFTLKIILQQNILKEDVSQKRNTFPDNNT